MKVRYNKRALAQLEDIHRYIVQHNPRAAARVVGEFKISVKSWETFPVWAV
jgi:plasmid stabilization system protein ParE